MAVEAATSELVKVVALLGAAVVMVPLFRRLGLGSVLGYFAAGLAIGPFGFGWFSDPQAILHTAELGVVMFLFVIGLEMRPSHLWSLRKEIFGLGTLQIVTCALVLTSIAKLFGLPWLVPVLATIGATFSVGYSLRLAAHLFFGQPRDPEPFARAHDPAAGMWAPSALLTVLAVLSSALLFAGCAAGPKPIYQWGGYQAQVYEHFKTQGNAPEAQIQAMEADLQVIAAKGGMAPPGYYAHLGLLYTEAGRSDDAAQALMKEKALFPESAAYVDFLLAKAKK